MNGLIVEIDLSHVVHVMVKFGLDEVVCDHGVPHRTSEMDVVVAKYLEVVLQILTHLEDFWVFIHLFKDINNLQRFFTFGWNGHIKCLEFLHSEAQTHQFCVDGRS